MAKQVESLRVVEGNNKIVRLFDTTLLDSSWFPAGYDFNAKDLYLVVVYDSIHDRYVPSVTANVFDTSTDTELGGKTGKIDVESKIAQARIEMAKQPRINAFFNDFKLADADFIAKASSQCRVNVKSLIGN